MEICRTNSKKVAFVAHGLGNGGAERAASILANQLSERGYEILYLAIYDNRITYSLNDKIKYFYLGADQHNKIIKYLVRSKSICDHLKRFQPDFVISFIVSEMVMAVKTQKYKYIFSERTNPAIKPRWLRLMTAYLYKKAYQVVFQTPGARDYFNMRIQKKGIIIANPINLENLPRWDCNAHNKSIITACRISAEKNLNMLIRSFEKIVRKHPDYILEIYGEPRQSDLGRELKILTKELKIADHVEFMGYHHDIHQIMSQSSIFVLTSNYEGLSNSMLEALCIGVPTICTDCPSGGAAMYIKDGQNGFLVDVGDSDALAEKLDRIINNKELQQVVSKNALMLRKQLDAQYVAGQWESLLR